MPVRLAQVGVPKKRIIYFMEMEEFKTRLKAELEKMLDAFRAGSGEQI